MFGSFSNCGCGCGRLGCACAGFGCSFGSVVVSMFIGVALIALVATLVSYRKHKEAMKRNSE